MSRNILSLKNVTFALAAALAAITTGCGMGTPAITEAQPSMVSGVVHGGQSPIQGAAVKFYSTTSSGYGAAGTLIGSATSDVNGNFTISPSVNSTTCPSTQYAYAVATGGYPSGQPTLNNTSSLLAAIVQPCSQLTSSTQITINEETTVAFGYAMNSFTTTTAVTGGYTANVGAPAANNAYIGSATSTAAAGLGHAGENALAMVNSTSGTANSQTPTIGTAGTTIYGSVPAAELNTLADILAACVNGATGNSGCTTLFGFTTSITGKTPTNTLQAMMYLARNPYPSTAAMNATTGLFSLVASSGSPFVPTLTAVPPDWSLAIVYINEGASANNPFVAQYYTALDANDTIYTGRSGTTATTPNLIGMNAYGTTVPAYSAGSVTTATRQIAPDALGNVFVTNNGTTVYQYNASTGGAPTTFVTIASGDIIGVAVDKSNNVWVGNAVTTANNVTEYNYSSGTYTANYTATAPGGFEPNTISIDGNQNVWLADYFTGGSMAAVLPNLTVGATSTYTLSGTSITPVSATFASSATKPLGLALDASGNAWYGITGSNTLATTGIEEVIPTLTTQVITSLTPQSLIPGTTIGTWSTLLPGIDGAGTLFIPDNLSSTELTALGIHVYSTQSSTSSTLNGSQLLSPASGYLGCYLGNITSVTTYGGPGTGTTCAGVLSNTYVSATFNPRSPVVDSTGSVWAGITNGGFTQFVGLAAPAYPLAASGKPGLVPGLTSVQALP